MVTVVRSLVSELVWLLVHKLVPGVAAAVTFHSVAWWESTLPELEL